MDDNNTTRNGDPAVVGISKFSTVIWPNYSRQRCLLCLAIIAVDLCLSAVICLIVVPRDSASEFILMSLIVLVIAVLMSIPVYLCCESRWRRKNLTKRLPVPHNDGLESIVHPLAMNRSTGVPIPEISFGAQAVIHPTAPSEVPMRPLGDEIDLPPSYSEVVRGSNPDDISGKVPPYHMHQREPSHPSPAYNPSFPSSPHSPPSLRQTQMCYSPSHSPLQSPGRMSPGRMSPGRMSPGRMSPGRMSPGRTSPYHSLPRSPYSSSPVRQTEGMYSSTNPLLSPARAAGRTADGPVFI